MDLASRRVVGGTLTAARMVAEGQARRTLHLGGGLHHAAHDHASGFCIYNDLAVAIKHLTRKDLNVAYLDVDVHHGDGVQHLFEADERVMTASLHESGRYLFPGTGDVHEIGQGMGRGLKLNLPLLPFTEDDSYHEVFDLVLPEALHRFRPDVLLVQAGADAHFDDPMADLLLTTRGYERIFRRTVELAEEFAGGRLVVALGGGYSMRAAPRVWTLLYLILSGASIPETLPDAWRAKWKAILGEELPRTMHDALDGTDGYPQVPGRAEITRHNRATAMRLLEGTRRYWR
jgi:acetoin utilization protein AcuC